nr:MAG TPA: hypothetical protein [Siphoviridae sp. ctjRi1]
MMTRDEARELAEVTLEEYREGRLPKQDAVRFVMDAIEDARREESEAMTKSEFLDEVKRIVAEREGQHGKPAETFKAIAAAWSVYLTAIVGVPVMLREEDVPMMLVELKVQRFAGGQGTHMDTLLDIAGYAACAGELASRGV